MSLTACLPIWNAEFLIHYGTITAVLLNTGLLLNPLFTSMIPMLSNPMVTNLRLWGLFVMALKVPLLKMFIKKAIMLRRLASWQTADILSASFPGFIPPRKRVTNLRIPSLFPPLKQGHSFLKKLLLLWTEAMMTTKCSPNLRNSDRIMWSDLPKNENSFFMENGFRLSSYVLVEKGKLNCLFFITERNTLRIFPMSKSRSRHQKKMSILFWFTASQNIRWCLSPIKPYPLKKM